MEKEKVIRTQVSIVICLIAFIFAFSSSFQKVLEVGSGLGIVTESGELGIEFGAIHLIYLSFLFFFLYLIFISLFLYFNTSRTLFILSQLSFWVGIFFIFLILIFIFPAVINIYNPY